MKRQVTTVVVRYHASNTHWLEYDVCISIDIAAIAKKMANDAALTKGKKSTKLGGAVECRVLAQKHVERERPLPILGWDESKA